MKETVITFTLAVSLGITGYGLSRHKARVSKTTNVGKAHSIDLAQRSPEELNTKPVQTNAYDIHFIDNGYQYNLTSNGSEWSWSYAVTGSDTGYTESSSNQEVGTDTQSGNTSVQAVSAPTSSESRSYSTSTTSYSAPGRNYNSHSSSMRLSDDDIAGSVGSYATAQMAVCTSVSVSAQGHVITRESSGQLHTRNASDAAGLFQTMPGQGSTGSVNDQINTVYKVYKTQGLSVQGM